MVPKNDHLWVGLVVSIIIPAIAYVLLLQLQAMIGEGAGKAISFELRTVALIAICLNVMPLNYFRKTYRNRSLRGLATGTMILAMAWFFYFGRDLLG
ncbi:hypothetical protein FUA23_19230 [Neolewinella aurantiaca]|uniref:Uncharacterized protein n=1 Tax=Neolewinella aurantiaca TaxID=2602767 RepID=A0A5C7FPQ0_9BACT|nr:hypothetical protein [Neolewinella aurantiaca]TXF86715.1 hypothetical protein FUA23_19230 [Neolewinella aurantiaca]